MEALSQSADCCATCTGLIETQVPGPKGDTGIGTNGADGSDGIDAFSLVNAQFVQPAIGANVTITLVQNNWMFVGQIIQITTGGWYEVMNVNADLVHAIVKNLGYTGNAAPAAVIPLNSLAAPGGIQGPSGAAGGAPDTGSYWCRVAEAGLSSETNMSALATGYLKVTTITGVPSSVTKIPYTDISTTGQPTTRILKPDGANGTESGQLIDNEIQYQITAIAAVDIDWAVDRVFEKTLAAATTFTFSNTVTGKQIIVIIKQDAAAAKTVAWPAGIKWSGGVAPTMSVTLSCYAVFAFIKASTGDIIGTVLNDAY